jgi:hypothetical protein
MEHSTSWQADSPSAIQGISRLLQNPMVHYCVHKSLPLVPSQMNPVHTQLPYFLKIHFNIVFPLTSWSSERFPPSKLSYQNFVLIFHLPCTCCMLRPSHPPWFDHPNNICWRKYTHGLIFGSFVLLLLQITSLVNSYRKVSQLPWFVIHFKFRCDIKL